VDGATTALKTFLLAADLPVVITAVVLTRMVELSLLTTPRWKGVAFWLPVAFAMLLTPFFSTSPETAWGGQYLVKNMAQNAAVAEVLWYIVLPRLRKKYDQWFGTANGGQ
jgi:hypothetical protein